MREWNDEELKLGNFAAFLQTNHLVSDIPITNHYLKSWEIRKDLA